MGLHTGGARVFYLVEVGVLPEANRGTVSGKITCV